MTTTEGTTERAAITLDQQLACVRRELAMRKNVYGKWVKGKKMTQEAADREINAMQVVHDSLMSLVWQPIETAPKDQAVLVTNGEAVGEAHWCEDSDGGGGWFWANCYPTDATDGAVWDAKFWMLLPAARKA